MEGSQSELVTTSSLRPRRFVISLSGSCCGCGKERQEDSQGSASTTENEQAKKDCSYFNGYYEVIQDKSDPDHYVHEFSGDAPFNAKTLEFRLNSDPNQPKECIHACAFITFGNDDEDNPVGSVGWGTVVKSIDKLGVLRRRSTNTLCCWPLKILVNPVPVPDYVTPQPEWMPGNPDDLNHAPFWPSLDFDLMEDSDYAPVRYANGELQLRIKDLSSEAFGVPWGHTRVYSNRLSNSYNYGNGFNWMIHEWPRLVRFKSPTDASKPPVGVTAEKKRTGCTIALVRGTRNALWFDEIEENDDKTSWEPRFNAKHVLKEDSDEHTIKLYAPNGHVWEFYDFTCPNSREFEKKSKKDREAIAPGHLKQHVGPYGQDSQKIKLAYKKCQLQTATRSASDITETFTYSWKEGHVENVTLSRKGGGGQGNVSRVKYTYYGDKETHGNKGDLKTARVEFWDGGWKSRKDTLQYFAYYTSANSTYAQGMLKAVVGPENYYRMRQVGRDPLSGGPEIGFSDLWIEYYADDIITTTSGARTTKQLVRRIQTIAMDGGKRKHSYTYGFSSAKGVFDKWFSEAREQRPDSGFVRVFSNEGGETLVHNLSDAQDTWTHILTRSSFGRMRNISTPSSSYFFGSSDNGTVNASSAYKGRNYSFFNEGALAYLSDLFVSSQPVISLESFSDTAPQEETSPTQATQKESVRLHHFEYQTRGSEEARIAYLQGDTNPECNLEFSRTWTPGGPAGQDTLEVRLPPIPQVEHGDGTSASVAMSFNAFGLPTESQNERGVVTTTLYYDELSIPKQIRVNSLEGESLVTDITADSHGRVVKTYGPWHRSVTDPNGSRTERVRRANWAVFDDVNGLVISSSGFCRSGGNEQLINPVSVSELDRAGRTVQQVNAIVRTTNSPGGLKANDVNSERTWCRKATRRFNNSNLLEEDRVYYDIQMGLSYATRYTKYDAMSRLEEYVSPDGTRIKTVYDVRGLPKQVLVGVDAISEVASYFYDNQSPTPNGGGDGSSGNGNLTTVVRRVKGGDRVTKMAYDWRDQVVSRKVIGKDALVSFGWDDAGRTNKLEIDTKDSTAWQSDSSTFKLESAMIPRFDSRGQIYQRAYIQRNLFGGVSGNNPDLLMTEQIWRDQSGNPTKVRPEGSLAYQVMEYDSLGRQTYRNHAFGVGDSFQQATGGGTVVSAVVTDYDSLGQPTLVTETSRAINEKQNPGSLASDNPTRSSFSGVFFDPLGRVVATVDYGTTWPRSSTAIPVCTDTTLVTRYYYNDRGELERVVNPEFQKTTFVYDDAGRVVLQNDNNVRAIRNRLLPDGRMDAIEEVDLRFDQTKRLASYLYGPQNASLDWDIQTNSLVAKVVDSDGSARTFGYNRQGEVTATQDSRGCKHVFMYDVYGRQTDDIVEGLGENVDPSTRRIHREFDDLGRLISVATYAGVDLAQGQEITKVSRGYSFAGQVNWEETLLNRGDRKSVTITYLGDQIVNQSQDLITQARETNSLRPIGLQYPSKRSIRLAYGSPYSSHWQNNSADYWLGRVTAIHNLGKQSGVSNDVNNYIYAEAYADYRYWGVGNIFRVNLAARNLDNFTMAYREGIAFDLGSGNTSKPFAALDGLGRLRRLDWNLVKANSNTSQSQKKLLSIASNFDRGSRCISQQLRTASSQSYSSKTFGYDDLNRLDFYERKNEGSSESPLVTPSKQLWILDGSGNWLNWDVSGDASLHQTRQHGPGDRIAAIRNLANETKWTQPGYDAAGNLTLSPFPPSPEYEQTIRYDAWNRPVSVRTPVSTGVDDRLWIDISYTYDGLGRIQRVKKPFETRRFSYSPSWQLLEEEVLSLANGDYRNEYIWGVRGPNDLICRERYDLNDALQERQYALSDANGNILGVVSDGDDELDRLITYDPYGNPVNEGDFRQLFGGYYYDSDTGLYLVRNRVYHPTLGRWLTKDPLGMVDGPNLYEYCAGDPVNNVDPSGGWIESAWDLFSLGLGIASYRHNLAEGNWGFAIADAIGITADAAALLLPIVPGGASVAIQGARVRQAARFIDRFSDVVKTADFGANAYQAYDAFEHGNYWGAGLGAAGLGIRAVQGSFILPRRYAQLNARWGTRDYPGVNNYDDWASLVSTRGGRTQGFQITNGRFLGPRYAPSIRNLDRLGTIDYLDTAAHESFHAFIYKHLPGIADASEATLGRIPIGAPIKYLEEAAAYGIGSLRVGRLHGVISSPILPFLSDSLNGYEKLVAAPFAIGGITLGAWSIYDYFAR
ncbi:hypothetical protein DTL42_13265 [Bremerella cremea]|uniref:Teneurin-like YD-shell domain-containing protein n=1 Tax=Bremerella cremea TaxID=1031537 RepID=A0A368KRH7_9BACT|nr:RHS repeat-associated core domain-containing protein [Bremerella cremea]RCS49488.1 hypothetical protein DTL42_13265 [Bremerella cremea]